MNHKTFEELQQIMKEVDLLIPIGSNWIHFKDTHEEHPYTVLNLAIEEASEAVVVIYRREDLQESFCWSRPVYGEKGWISKTESGQERFIRLQINTK